MPPNDGIGLDEYERRAPVPPDVCQHDPEEPIAGLEAWTLRRTCGGLQLLPQREVLQHDVVVPTANQGQPATDQTQEFQHARIVACSTAKINPGAFWRTTGLLKYYHRAAA